MSRPNAAYTKSLREDACNRFPRLKWDLSDNAIAEFMTDGSWPKAQKFRDSRAMAGPSNLWPKATRLGISAMAHRNGTMRNSGLIANDGNNAKSGGVVWKLGQITRRVETVEWELGTTYQIPLRVSLPIK
jgi:hypothetical protein